MWGIDLSSSRRIGMIAGSGEYPVILAQALKSVNRQTLVIGIQGITQERIADAATEAHFVKWGDIEGVVRILKDQRVKELLFAGGIPKKDLFDPKKPVDTTTQGILNRSGNRGDDHLLRAFQAFFRIRCGIRVIDSRAFLKDTLAIKGVMTRRQPDTREQSDLRLGLKVARSIGRMDIGQTVVIKQGVVIAVEGIEGTDAAIRRSAALCGEGAVVVKTSKPGQELKFDLPCVGHETLESIRSSGVSALGLEAGKTLMLKRAELIQKADEIGLTIVGF